MGTPRARTLVGIAYAVPRTGIVAGAMRQLAVGLLDVGSAQYTDAPGTWVVGTIGAGAAIRISRRSPRAS